MMRRIFERVTEIYGEIEWWAWKARRWLARYWGWILLIVLSAAGSLTWLFWDVLAQWIDCLWDWGRTEASGDSKTETLRNLVWAIGGGGAAGFGLLLAFWRSGLAHLQARTAERGLNNERYQKGADMLGSATLATRMGGVYALETLAQERPYDYYIQIAKLLCAFIRHPADHDKPEAKAANGEGEGEPVATSITGEKTFPPAIQAATQILGKRSKKQIRIERREKFRLDLQGANLSDAVLRGADLSGADLRGADLSDARLPGVGLSGVDLRGANLSGADLRGANLSGAALRGADLPGADLRGVNLSGAALWGANLSGTALWNANLSGALLPGANLSGARLPYTNLSGAALEGADLSDADLSGADLSGAFLSDANFSGVKLGKVKNLTQTQLDDAFIWKRRKPPTLEGAVDSETGAPLKWQGEVRPDPDPSYS